MPLRSYSFFRSEGDWSRYLTIKDAFSGEAGSFLGSVDSFIELPLTTSDARTLWGLTVDPMVGDTAFVNIDIDHGNNPSQYLINNIDGVNLSWKYQFSIPVPSGVLPDNITIDKNSSNELEVMDSGISTVKLANNSVTTPKIADSNVTTAKIADVNVTTAKLANNSVTTIKVADANITEPKLASNSVTTAKIVDNAVTTSKILDKNITLPKIAVGTEAQVLRTVSGEAVWSQEQDISNKADKFLYTPASSTETLYNLNDIQSINVEGNGGGVDPNTGIVYTNFAGESVTIPIEGGAGFFNYKGQVATYEDLPEFDDTVSNGDLYSIAASIDFKGTVASMGDLPESPADYDQYFVTAPGTYNYWDSSVGASGEWIENHCQFDNGCNDTGWYAFGIGDVPNWNRLDGELSVDQVLDTDSPNAIANRVVAQSLLTKLNMFSPNTLSEFFNENDGGGLVYYDSDGHEVAGLCLNVNVPQLYIHRYDGAGDLTSRVLFEIHDDGAYISTVLNGTAWVRVATVDDINNLFQDYTPDTSYVKNTILRGTVVDATTYNKYGFAAYDFESTVDFESDVDSLYIDEIVSMRELNDTLEYCIDEYFPSPPRSA
jgi:hypothetical protein